MILVVGGAGYIGSHFVREMVKTEQVIVLDNLTTGNRAAVHEDAIFIYGDVSDENRLSQIFHTYPIQAVVHFAAYSLVGESVSDPKKYYENNVAATLTLLRTMLKYNVKNIVFSSTAATYGVPLVEHLNEGIAPQPINPYGRSKFMVEQILEDYKEAYGLCYVVLRYFNAAGSDESGEIGECHEPESHLIPIILQHLLGQSEKVVIFGDDYQTYDGTCIRDYIHVTDLAQAHILALESLLNGVNQGAIYNLGNGNGYSVKEVLAECERVTGLPCNIEVSEKRQGDPAQLIANADKIKQELGWIPTRTLRDIIETAWRWHSNPKYKKNQEILITEASE